MARGDFWREGLDGCDFNGKADLEESFLEIVSIHSKVVFLAESFFAFGGRGYRGVFVGVGGRVFLRNGEYGEAFGLQDAVEFAHGGEVVGNMFEHIAGDDDIIGVRRDLGHCAHVEFEVAVASVVVSGCVFSSGFLDSLTQLALRREVDNFFSVEQRLFVHVV